VGACGAASERQESLVKVESRETADSSADPLFEALTLMISGENPPKKKWQRVSVQVRSFPQSVLILMF